MILQVSRATLPRLLYKGQLVHFHLFINENFEMSLLKKTCKS